MNWNDMTKAGVSVLAVTFCIGAQAAGVTVSISPDKRTLGQSDDVVMHVTMTNTSSTPQYILKWHTPFGAIEEALFEVTRDGARVPYLGAHIKRGAPTAGDYYLLKPGASYKAKVELSALYNMSITGDYSIRYRAKSFDLADAKEASALESEAVQLWIDGRQPRGTVEAEPLSIAALRAGGGAGLAYSNCSSKQQSSIASAVSAAKNMANGANAYLGAGSAGQRYTKWFGVYSSARYATVKSHFAAIKDAFDTKPVVVDCSCKQSYYAYVYPSQPYKIYVCNAFWRAQTTGTDSKGGTLIHEMSHFNVVAGTEDWAYGQSAAASLALGNPGKAVDNADSHEYFAENTPSLP